MPSLIKKMKKGKPYWYIVECQRVNGKPRIVAQHYLGSVEQILKMHQSTAAPTPKEVGLVRVGPMALYDIAISLELPQMIDAAFPKREQGAALSQYLLLAALNRAFYPCSKVAIGAWYEQTALKRIWGIKPDTFSSQNFWNAMDRIDLERLTQLQRDIYVHVARKEGLELKTFLYDATNYFTFIDTLNDRNEGARRGRNKQKRNDLRQLGLAAAVTADYHIPLYHCLYPGNLNDITQFKACYGDLVDRLRALGGNANDLTLIFDKGNMSEEILFYMDDQQVHIIGSTPASKYPRLAKVSLDQFKQTDAENLPGVTSWRTTEEIAGSKWTMVIAHSTTFAARQYQSIATSQAKAIVKLDALSKKLKRGEKGKHKLAAIRKRVAEILAPQHMKKIICTEVLDKKGRIFLNYSLDQRALSDLMDFQLGRTVLITNRHDWSDSQIIQGYRGQAEVERMFQESKDPDHLSFRPTRHWTDQKLHVHSFYCILAQLLTSLLVRRLALAGFQIPPLRMLEELHGLMEALLFYSPSQKGPARTGYSKVRQNQTQKRLFDALGLEKYLR